MQLDVTFNMLCMQLTNLYNAFDKLVDKFSVYKVEVRPSCTRPESCLSFDLFSVCFLMMLLLRQIQSGCCCSCLVLAASASAIGDSAFADGGVGMHRQLEMDT